jgi:hypothetical protein
MADSVGKAKIPRRRIQIETAGVTAYKAMGVIHFPHAKYQGKDYQVFLIPNDGVQKLAESEPEPE